MGEVTLVGGGLAGSLLALMLARRGLKITLYERRPDLRIEQIEEGRSINLALSTRGIHALKRVGLDEEVLARAISMRGRYIHPVSGTCSLIPYGRKADEVIHSVSRRDLNVHLLDALSREKNVSVLFHHRCTGYNLKTRTLSIRDEGSGKESTVSAPVVIGADGAASAVRLALMLSTRMNYSQEYLDHGYKELTIPPGPDGSYRMEPHALHIWPRGGYMMIALPNMDRSFTCTLFFPHRGAESFETLSSRQQVAEFFGRTFPDAVPLLTDLEQEFFRNPTGGLVTVRCSPWYQGGQVLLLGDAAHALVPFYGQGMNCAFEDCEVLLDMFEQQVGRWEEIFPRFFQERKQNADAIAQLAIDNFIEMRDTSADPHFALKRQVEHLLEERFPGQFVSKYGMVTFHRFPYVEALKRGRIQDQILMEVCSKANAVSEIDLDATFGRLRLPNLSAE